MQVCCGDCDDSLTRLWLSGRLRLHSLSNRNWHCSNKEFTTQSLVKNHCIQHKLKPFQKICNSKTLCNNSFLNLLYLGWLVTANVLLMRTNVWQKLKYFKMDILFYSFSLTETSNKNLDPCCSNSPIYTLSTMQNVTHNATARMAWFPEHS